MGLPLLSALLSCHVMLSFVFCYVEGSYDYPITSYKTLAYTKKIMNPIDACWRFDARWASSRQKLADCAVGFGKSALGGKYGAIYTVTDPSDDPVYPKPGTLRYGVIQSKPLWIIFRSDMVIKLKNELKVNSNKTIDGRGAKVEIAYGPCITIQEVSHVIVHGLSIHDCTRGDSDGDAITVLASSNVWIDHCTLSRAFDGLIDVTHGSTAVTISNNYYSNHDKVTYTTFNF